MSDTVKVRYTYLITISWDRNDRESMTKQELIFGTGTSVIPKSRDYSEILTFIQSALVDTATLNAKNRGASTGWTIDVFDIQYRDSRMWKLVIDLVDNDTVVYSRYSQYSHAFTTFAVPPPPASESDSSSDSDDCSKTTNS